MSYDHRERASTEVKACWSRETWTHDALRGRIS